MPVWAPKETCDKVLPGLAKKEIIVPAWNDIIHLTRPPSYDPVELATMKDIYTRNKVVGWTPSRIAEYLDMPVEKVVDYLAKYRDYNQSQNEIIKRKQEAAINLMKSPTPQLASNIGTIMTALDDIQDFTTTVGVIARALGRVFKPAELLAIGAFTVGELLNRLNMMSRLTGSEKAIICHAVKELKKSGMWSRVKADVDKRMKRMFPSQGEIAEILQTTDMLFGIGISFGPLVGLAEDALFGALTGAPLRFKKWKISQREKDVLSNIADRFIHPEKGFEAAFKDIAKWGEAAANVTVSGMEQGWNDFATGLVTTIATGVQVRCTGVKDAAISIWEMVTGKGAATKKKTLESTKDILRGVGVDPSRVDDWPVPGLGATATIQEIMDAYSTQANKVLHYWRVKTQGTDEGLFLDACVKEIGLHASAMFCAEDGKITESLNPFVIIFIHALESGLNPPVNTSNEVFQSWARYVESEMSYLGLSAPPLKLLQKAYQEYFQ